MSIQPLNVKEELAKIDQLKADCIAARIAKFGETPEQAEKAYEEILQSLFFASFPKVLKWANAQIKALK